MRVIYVDIDETICNRESSVDFGVTHDYTKAHPIVENIEKINKLYSQDKISLIQKGKMMDNLTSFQMMTSKEKKFFKKLEKKS